VIGVIEPVGDWSRAVAVGLAESSSRAPASGSLRPFRPGWTFVDACRRAFQALRPGLTRSSVIGVVSPNRGDGRSSVAAALAMVVARETDEPTLLVDLDFEHPTLAEFFGVVPSRGLQDTPSGAIPLLSVSDPGEGRLLLLPGGTGNPGTLTSPLRAVDLEGLLRACREQFRWIVLDLPPLSPKSPEAAPAAGVADAYVLLARQRRTMFGAIQLAAQLVPPGRPRILLMTQGSGRHSVRGRGGH
jgi:Mrp family chromosome partitioning ATPase